MYWHKLDATDRLSLAQHIYLAALRLLREDGAGGLPGCSPPRRRQER